MPSPWKMWWPPWTLLFLPGTRLRDLVLKNIGFTCVHHRESVWPGKPSCTFNWPKQSRKWNNAFQVTMVQFHWGGLKLQHVQTEDFFFFFFWSCWVLFFHNFLQLYCPNGIYLIGNLGCLPRGSQLRQSRATQPKVHAGCYSFSVIHRTLTWIRDL